MAYKICFITTIPMTINAFIRDFADYLQNSGDFEIYFICDEDEKFALSLNENITYIPIKMKRGISISGVGAVFKMMKEFKKHKFDLVQYSTPNASCYASIASFLTRVPTRLYCQWGIAYVGFSGIKRKIFKFIEKIVCRLSTHVHPDSHSNLNFSFDEKLYTHEKGSVVWNGSASGVNLAKFDIEKKSEWKESIRTKYGIPLDAFVYIFVGRINADKGINELFTAAKSIIQDKDNVYLLMVGSTEMSEGVDAELYQWSINEKRVIYAGFTNEVEKYMAASDVYVLPSYREGFGSSVIEAEAMGVPVIVTAIPGPINAMENGQTGHTVPKADSEALYLAMCDLYNNDEVRHSFGASAVEFVKSRFDQKVLFEKMKKDRLSLIEERK